MLTFITFKQSGEDSDKINKSDVDSQQQAKD